MGFTWDITDLTGEVRCAAHFDVKAITFQWGPQFKRRYKPFWGVTPLY